MFIFVVVIAESIRKDGKSGSVSHCSALLHALSIAAYKVQLTTKKMPVLTIHSSCIATAEIDMKHFIVECCLLPLLKFMF
jgi:hypothetical protein